MSQAGKQWAAVTMYLEATNAPPQNPTGLSVSGLVKATIQGYLFILKKENII